MQRSKIPSPRKIEISSSCDFGTYTSTKPRWFRIWTADSNIAGFFFFQCIELHKCIQKFTLLNMSTFQTTSMKMGDKHIKVNSLMEIKCPKVELKVRRDVQISKNTKEQK